MKKKKFFIFVLSLIFFIALSAGLDRLVGLFVPAQTQTAGFIFPRNVSHQFRTSEFSFTVQTNSLGFRDREFAPSRTAKFRVLAIGDSFTYGWGVEADQSWPKVLESQLRALGYDVEVANLGKPNGSPKDYADIAEQATSILKPDLLIVGVLQGDDLAQMEPLIQPAAVARENQNQPAQPNFLRRSLQTVGRWLYPHFLTLLGRRPTAGNLLEFQWKEDARKSMSAMTPAERQRFDQLDTEVKNRFVDGDLNPALVYLGVAKPDYFLQSLDQNSTKVKSLTSEMGRQIARIASVAKENNARVLVVSVPYGLYVSRASFASRQRLGFSVAPEMLTTNAEDEAVRNACQIAGVDFYNVTDRFRAASVYEQLFFELDGHFNPAGHRYFAEALAPGIKSAIDPGTGK